MIYFVLRDDVGDIKIGTTKRLSQRLKSLAIECGSKLKVLAIQDGGPEQEKLLHRKFAHLDIGGEWFKPGEDLLDFIKTEARPWDGTDDKKIRHARIELPNSDYVRVKKGAGRFRLSVAAYVRLAVLERIEADERRMR